MRAGSLSDDEQAAELAAALRRNRTLTKVLARAPVLGIPDWYLVAGCLSQTVWNLRTGQPPEHGIGDYDLIYFDASDLSWEAEDAVIRAGEKLFAGLPAPVQIRNQARVHLWYEQKFGVPCPPHESAEAAIGTFEATVACVGIRSEPGGRWRVYAPYGLADVFGMVVRPNPVLATRPGYEAKVARWQRRWPGLIALPWSGAPVGAADNGGMDNYEPPVIADVAPYLTDPRVDAYIDALPDWQQAICQQVRDLVHAADPEVTETIKRTRQPYFVLAGNVCALLAAADHVNVFLYDGAIVPDPEGIITGGHGNKTARTVAFGRDQPINAPALTEMFRRIIANNRAGGWRKLKAAG